MREESFIWIFHGRGARFSGGAFRSLEAADVWIQKHGLTGLLTAYPVDEGVFDWAIREGLTSASDDSSRQIQSDPDRIGAFTTASMEHFHYENGVRYE